ncbi:MAG: RsmD family RNA methyltransferase [Planctomycetota bacterium]|nr:RsmD family RNA methyltransferase [Planctomycetota bacterium]
MRIQAGRLKGRALPVPRGARPASGRLKTSLFSVLAGYIDGARVLDLCAGAGALGLEALSRGAASVVLVDREPRTVKGLRAWLAEADREGRGDARRGDVLRGPLPPGPFDLIFLDPPFVLWEGSEAATMVGRAVSLLAPEGLLACKLPAKSPLPEDPRWRLVRHTAVASAAYALLAIGGETDAGDKEPGPGSSAAGDRPN